MTDWLLIACLIDWLIDWTGLDWTGSDWIGLDWMDWLIWFDMILLIDWLIIYWCKTGNVCWKYIVHDSVTAGMWCDSERLVLSCILTSESVESQRPLHVRLLCCIFMILGAFWTLKCSLGSLLEPLGWLGGPWAHFWRSRTDFGGSWGHFRSVWASV